MSKLLITKHTKGTNTNDCAYVRAKYSYEKSRTVMCAQRFASQADMIAYAIVAGDLHNTLSWLLGRYDVCSTNEHWSCTTDRLVRTSLQHNREANPKHVTLKFA